MQLARSRDSEQISAKDEFEECAPDRCGHLLRQVKEQCPPTETTLLLSIERSHALRATAVGVKRPSVPAKRSLETASGAAHSGVAYASPGF
jgi:hypothetical protein